MFFEPPGSVHEQSAKASQTEPAQLLAMIFAKKGSTLTTPVNPGARPSFKTRNSMRSVSLPSFRANVTADPCCVTSKMRVGLRRGSTRRQAVIPETPVFTTVFFSRGSASQQFI